MKKLESEDSGPPTKKKRAARRNESDEEMEQAHLAAERQGRRARKAVSYTSKYDDLEFTDSHDEFSEEEEEQVKKPKGMVTLADWWRQT